MENSKPFDTLNSSISKRIVVELKNGRQLVGKLKAWDQHVNIVMEGVEIVENNEVKRKIGNAFIRGDTIILISPE